MHINLYTFSPVYLWVSFYLITRILRQSVHFYSHASGRDSYKKSFTKPKKREIGSHYQWWKEQVKLAWRTRSKLFSRWVLHTTNPELRRRQFSLSYISSWRSVWATEDLSWYGMEPEARRPLHIQSQPTLSDGNVTRAPSSGKKTKCTLQPLHYAIICIGISAVNYRELKFISLQTNCQYLWFSSSKIKCLWEGLNTVTFECLLV